jgi:HK97 gp10 family phage protein
MMPEIKNVSGLKELQAAMKELPANIARNVLRGAVNAGATVIREEAKARAPKFEGKVAKGQPPAGTLKRALYQKQIREKSSAVLQTFYVGVRQGRSAKKTKKGSIDAWYARFVEFGTSKMAARPFMRPAFEAKKEAAVQAIKNYLEKRIPEEVQKARKK